MISKPSATGRGLARQLRLRSDPALLHVTSRGRWHVAITVQPALELDAVLWVVDTVPAPTLASIRVSVNTVQVLHPAMWRIDRIGRVFGPPTELLVHMLQPADACVDEMRRPALERNWRAVRHRATPNQVALGDWVIAARAAGLRPASTIHPPHEDLGRILPHWSAEEHETAARLLAGPFHGSLPEPQRWPFAVQVLDEGREFDRGARWGVYNIQRLYLDVLEALHLREETLPGDPARAELVFYSLGKFSQVISDFEEMYFSTAPYEKYTTFARWLTHQAPDYYAESDADVGYATPDAVVLSTVHQAKGMQWPAVFVPCLRRNRFPSQRWGGLGLFHVIPQQAVHDADRYRGTLEDETRLFYVAITRAQTHLAVTYSPGPSRFQGRSEFFDHCTRSSWVSTRDPGPPAGKRLAPRPRHETPQVTLSFSELKYWFECPYEFKLRFLYGFNPPLHEALGYGKGLHDALAEVHKRALTGDVLAARAAVELVDRHLHTPFAYPELRESLRRSAIDAVVRYLDEHRSELPRTIHSEKQIQVHVAPGIVVDGRIDLVRRLDTDELAIVDFKSTDRAQAEEVTWDQLHVYAVGYEELTGERADVVEVLNLDERAQSHRDEVSEPLLAGVRERIRLAGESLRTNDLPRQPTWCKVCERCDLAALCRAQPIP